MSFQVPTHPVLAPYSLDPAADITITSLDIIKRNGFPSTNTVVISCFQPPGNFPSPVFGDFIPLNDSWNGPWIGPADNPGKIFNEIKDRIANHGHRVVMLAPQRYPQNVSWDHPNFVYLELPEFYGVYWNFYQSATGSSDYNPYNTANISKHFLCFNKVITSPRLICICEIFWHNLLDKGYVSFLGEGRGHRRRLVEQGNEYNSKNHYPNYEYFDMIVERHLSQESVALCASQVKQALPIQNTKLLEITDTTMGSGGWTANHELFETSFVNVIAETYESGANGSSVFTEKIFKTIYHRRPFMMIAPQNSLVELRALGFKTFDQWWPETYDYETSPVNRARLIMAQVDQLCQLPIADIHAVFEEMIPTLEHNYQRLQELSKKLPDKINTIDNWIIDRFCSTN